MYIWGSHTGIYFPSRGFWTPNPSKVGVYNCAYWALLQTYFILQTFIFTLSPLSKHRRIWYGGRGGSRPPWGSRLTLIRARNGGLLGQKDLFLLLDWVLGHRLPPPPPLANAIKYVYDISKRNRQYSFYSSLHYARSEPPCCDTLNILKFSEFEPYDSYTKAMHAIS